MIVTAMLRWELSSMRNSDIGNGTTAVYRLKLLNPLCHVSIDVTVRTLVLASLARPWRNVLHVRFSVDPFIVLSRCIKRQTRLCYIDGFCAHRGYLPDPAVQEPLANPRYG